jgi:hypothetical protein
MKIVNDKPVSEFEKVKRSVINAVPDKNLREEQDEIAKLKKYQVMGLGNVGISDDFYNKIKKPNIYEKNTKNKYNG